MRGKRQIEKQTHFKKEETSTGRSPSVIGVYVLQSYLRLDKYLEGSLLTVCGLKSYYKVNSVI